MTPKHFLFALALLLGATATAQFGVSGFYNFNDARWQSSATPADAAGYGNGPEVALNYWFRLPKKRVEFQPTVYYARGGGDPARTELGLQFKTNLYLFDFGTDCNCPTFGKQGPQLQKGFFLQLTPGVALHRSAAAETAEPGTRLVPTVGGGVGIDFGLSNLLTLTPLAGLRYTLGSYDDAVATNTNGQDTPGVEPRLLTLQLGLQVTFRLDRRRY